MTPVILACLWLIAANLIAVFPSRDHHWRAAYGLMTLGLPLTIWLCATHGALPTTLFLLAAASILRWPLRFALRWVVAQLRS